MEVKRMKLLKHVLARTANSLSILKVEVER